jgi:alkanesulfonate monooxygenase SsuD/methylene tetrahydromethanopterin reductase-like flavin-dependent oxidoreductase (luciferase family)
VAAIIKSRIERHDDRTKDFFDSIGHERRFRDVGAMSALPLIADDAKVPLPWRVGGHSSQGREVARENLDVWLAAYSDRRADMAEESGQGHNPTFQTTRLRPEICRETQSL